MSDGVISEKYSKLLESFANERIEYDGMLDSIKKFREEAFKVVPSAKSSDYRNKSSKYSKFEMEEKLRIVSNTFSTELSIRKAKSDNLVKEIELSRKISGEDKSEESKFADIMALAKGIERLEGKRVSPVFDED